MKTLTTTIRGTQIDRLKELRRRLDHDLGSISREHELLKKLDNAQNRMAYIHDKYERLRQDVVVLDAILAGKVEGE